jgi:hypothetical protein
VSVAKLALAQEAHYEQQVALGLDDYYAGRGESPGLWAGSGAEGLEDGDLGTLLRGVSPADDTRLRAPARERTITVRTLDDVSGEWSDEAKTLAPVAGYAPDEGLGRAPASRPSGRGRAGPREPPAADGQVASALAGRLLFGPGAAERVTVIEGVSIEGGVARVATKLGADQDFAAAGIAARACAALALARGGSGVSRVEVVDRRGRVLESCSP